MSSTGVAAGRARAAEQSGTSTMRDDVDDVDDVDDADVPLAANAENRALHLEVKAMERKLLEIEAEIEANDERVKAMVNHTKNVEQEARAIQNVAVARDKEVETEERIARLAESEAKALELEAKRDQAAIEENTALQNSLQSQIFKLQEEMDAMRAQMEWDEAQLQEWLENAQLREEDTEALRKYEREDEARAKELLLELERLNVEELKAERQLEAEVTNTRSHRLGLDKVSQLFKDAHKERAEVIRQWEGTVQRLETEDAEIDAAATKFQTLKAAATAARLAVSEREAFLEEQDAANKDVLTAVEKEERLVAELEAARSNAQAQSERFQSELDSLRNVLARTSTEEQRQSHALSALEESVAAKRQQLAAANAEVDRLAEELETLGRSALTAEEQAAALEQQLQEEETYTRDVQRQIDAVSARLASVQQTNHDLKSQSTALQAEIDGAEQAERNSWAKLGQIRREIVHQGQIMYKQDFQSAILERKLLKMEGAVVDESEVEAERALKAEVEELRGILAEHDETKKLLRAQLRRLEDETRVARKQRDAQAAVRERQAATLAEIELYNEGASKELTRVVDVKQNLMVDENLLKLQLRRLRKQLDDRADDVLSLEQRTLELKTAMQERIHEIKAHKELLQVQKNECTRERSRITKELAERRVRIDQLRKRHEIVSFGMKGSSDGDDDHSEAYMIVKMAQEREELQQQGDALDAQIQKQEKELRMLNNTLQLMSDHNHKYKASLRRANGETEEEEAKAHLEGQLRTALDKYKHKRRELQTQEQERDDVRQTYDAEQKKVMTARRNADTLRAEVDAMQREIDEQQGKLDRAREQARKIVQSFRKESGGPPHEETVAEKDFMLQNTKEFAVKVLDAIDAIVEEVPDLRPEVSLLYSSYKIERPARRAIGARAGGQRGSAGGSVSSSSRPSSSRASLSSRGSTPAGSLSRVATSRPGSHASSVRSTTSSVAGSRRTTAKQPGTSNAAAAQRASVVTPRTIELGITGTRPKK